MRFMVIRRADKSTEAGGRLSKKLFDAMTKYHEEAARAGIVLDGVGLQPSQRGHESRSPAAAQSPTARSPRPRSSSPASR